jgi:hypothetical protein
MIRSIRIFFPIMTSPLPGDKQKNPYLIENITQV